MALIVLHGGHLDGEVLDFDVDQSVYYAYSQPMETYRRDDPIREVVTKEGPAVVYTLVPSP